MKRYILAPEAAGDLKAIRAYLKREAGLSVAQATLKKIREAFVFPGRTPGAGHLREGLTDAPVRFWPVFSYLVIYDSAPRPIDIVRVVHGRRDIPALLSQDD